MSGVGARSAYLGWLAQALRRPTGAPDLSVQGDLVLGYATGYDAADIAPFVRSLRSVFSGTKISPIGALEVTDKLKDGRLTDDVRDKAYSLGRILAGKC